MAITRKAKTPEQIEVDVERHSQLGKKFAAMCEGMNAEDVFYASLLFFSNNYALNFGEHRRARVIRTVHDQFARDILDAAQDEARQHWGDCQDCRCDMPCQSYFKILESIDQVSNAHTLLVNPDGSFTVIDQGVTG
jgi:hypothetical protein